ncbi:MULTISPECIES: hypothetical protein [unclassified Streptomyces]|uniref:hypothetical protein n=1 Tax=unclassified Streptomyces TaxID=2593676 RepID=UPI002E0DC7BF|nr:hypothetical protein OG452_22005 [Streptomyces sp. NBC_01197]WSS49517.1 hypothetical protein OG708_13260 [Streptomyces sp. NBC_01180]
MSDTNAKQNARSKPAWIAPLVSTFVTLPCGLVAFTVAALSGMACDSCSEAELNRFSPSYSTGFDVFIFGLLLPLGFLLASWSLPRQQRNNDRRLLLALAAPVSLLLVFLLFRGLVDWP